MARTKFVVLGAGAWGTAMAIHLAGCGHGVFLVPRHAEQAERMALDRENREHFPGFPFPENLCIDASFDCLRGAEVALLGCATAGVMEFCHRIRAVPFGPTDRRPPLLALCKGLVPESRRLPAVVISEMLPDFPVGVLSGPTHAQDVARGNPTAAVVAVHAPPERVLHVQSAMSSPSFRIYRSGDVRGVALGGALKNPYAIGMGIGTHFAGSDNGRAALLTRMVAELARIGVALGGKLETFYGLSGLGDLIATSTGEWSRNRTFGEWVGNGEKPDRLIDEKGITVEGYGATAGFYAICRERAIDSPILDGIHGILYEGRPPADIREALMCRKLREEGDHATNTSVGPEAG